MRYTGRTSGMISTDYLPLGVKWLLIGNIAMFVLYVIAVQMKLGALFHPFGLIPGSVVGSFQIWQLVTYMFLHDPYGIWHILFNMLTLWMFGRDLEQEWGRREFLRYYVLCGVGAGVCVILASAMFGNMHTRTIGASGAIYGLLLAYGVMFPDRILLFSFLFPIKAKYFVMIIGAIAFFYTSVGSGGDGVSHVAHLGGMVFGYVYLKGFWRRRIAIRDTMSRQYHQWRIDRAKRKFQVYMRKHDRDIH